MSDTSQGEGWWQGSDGKWYPPMAKAASGALPNKENRTRWGLMTLIGAGIFVAFLVSIALMASLGGSGNGSGTRGSGVTATTTASATSGVSASAWASTSTPAPPSNAVDALYGVSCTSSAFCMAVGSRCTTSPQSSQCASTPLTEEWNGSTWTEIQSVGEGATLSAVSCISASACMAVGYSGGAGGASSRVTVAEQWNGSVWTFTPTQEVRGESLTSVSCTSDSACMAVGDSGNATLAEQWNGSVWSMIPTPNGSGEGSLSGVSCSSSSACMAVGSDFVTQSGGGYHFNTLAEQWGGSAWTVTPSPNIGGGAGASMTTVSCPSPSSCIAVGGAGAFSASQQWNGSTWVNLPPLLSHSGTNTLFGVSCTSSNACTAVEPNSAELWDGSAWTLSAIKNGPNVQLAAVSCGSPVSCMAVGSSSIMSADSGNSVAERWSGP